MVRISRWSGSNKPKSESAEYTSASGKRLELYIFIFSVYFFQIDRQTQNSRGPWTSYRSTMQQQIEIKHLRRTILKTTLRKALPVQAWTNLCHLEVPLLICQLLGVQQLILVVQQLMLEALLCRMLDLIAIIVPHRMLVLPVRIVPQARDITISSTRQDHMDITWTQDLNTVLVDVVLVNFHHLEIIIICNNQMTVLDSQTMAMDLKPHINSHQITEVEEIGENHLTDNLDRWL